MKRTFIIPVVLTLLAVAFIIGCSKNIKSTELKDPSQLSEDKVFIDLATETYDYLLFISTTVKQNHLPLQELQAKLSNLQSKGMTFDQQMTSLDIIFKGLISQRLRSHMQAYTASWNIIKLNYSTITSEILEKECAEILSNKFSMKKENKNIAMRAVDCGWRFYLCSGAATAGAILCHAGCDTTALATTAGLGIPACVALCGTLQAFAIVQCSDNYCSGGNPS